MEPARCGTRPDHAARGAATRRRTSGSAHRVENLTNDTHGNLPRSRSAARRLERPQIQSTAARSPLSGLAAELGGSARPRRPRGAPGVVALPPDRRRGRCSRATSARLAPSSRSPASRRTPSLEVGLMPHAAISPLRRSVPTSAEPAGVTTTSGEMVPSSSADPGGSSAAGHLPLDGGGARAETLPARRRRG